jgi:hypothetical protein
MMPNPNSKFTMPNHFAMGNFGSSPAGGLLILHFTFLMGLARRGG